MREFYTGTCEKHGEFEGTAIKALGRLIEMGCPLCNKEHQDEEKRRESEEKERRDNERIAIGISLSKIPVRYQGHTSFTPRENQKIKSWDRKKNIAIIGGTGSGKTAYACHLGIKTIYGGDTVRYAPAYEFISKVKNGWGDSTSEKILQDYINADLVIIDEIGRGNYDEYLFRLFDGRYNLNKPTIIIGNVTFDEIPKVLGEAIASRLRGLGVVGMNFGIIDHREKEVF